MEENTATESDPFNFAGEVHRVIQSGTSSGADAIGRDNEPAIQAWAIDLSKRIARDLVKLLEQYKDESVEGFAASCVAMSGMIGALRGIDPSQLLDGMQGAYMSVAVEQMKAIGVDVTDLDTEEGRERQMQKAMEAPEQGEGG